MRADVPSLTVGRGRVVDREEDVEQVAERQYLRVERDLHDLGVPGRSRAHVLVARARHVTARVARLDPLDAL